MWQSKVLSFLLIATLHCDAFVSPSASTRHEVPSITSTSTTTTSSTKLNAHKQLKNTVASSLLAASLVVAASSPLPAQAYQDSDYASETVQEVIGTLKQNRGSIDGTFQAYENLAEIISEGKGVGGMVNYQGIQLERGYIADEDTTIYNPGLTLLTESEKERLVSAVTDSRKAGLDQGQWNEDIEKAYGELRGLLDPYHMAELSGFLGFVPYYGAILYLAVFAVNQLARDLFPAAYGLGVVAFFIPILALVAAGPQ